MLTSAWAPEPRIRLFFNAVAKKQKRCPHHVLWLWAAAAKHLQTTLWTWNWHSNLPAACQSQEAHLYASKPLAWSLTWQSSVNYPVTDNLAVISQTIKQAIKLFWIASSGPERLPTSPFNRGAKAARPPHDIGWFIFLFIRLLICLSAWLSPGERGLQSLRKGPRSDSAVMPSSCLLSVKYRN